MRVISSLVLVSCYLTTSLCGQEQGKPMPPKELAKLQRLIGNWEGSGTFKQGADGPEGKWTAKVQYTKAMDGFFVQEDAVVDLGAGMPAPMVWRAYHGFDPQTKKYFVAGVSNMSPASVTEIHWADDDTMITIETKMEEGQVAVERWVTKLASDSYSVKGYQTVGAGEEYAHVQGAFKRTKDAHEGVALDAAAGFGPPADEMERINKMSGRYRLKGTYQMSPEIPAMEIGAAEVIHPIFGGYALAAEVQGDPMPELGTYKAWAAFTWNPDKNCYTQIYVNNMGEIGSAEMRWMGEQLVSTAAEIEMRMPSVMRGLIQFAADGSIQKASMHSIMGTHAPMKAFEATYTKEE